MIRTIIEVSDGGFDCPREALLPADIPSSLAEAWPAVVTVPYRPLIVDVDGTLVLLDTGAGPLGPGTGKLHESLIEQSIAPEQISLVLLSHAHADHIGGLLDGDARPAFPNARIVMARLEFEFWHNSGVRDRLGSGSVYGNAMIESVIRDPEWTSSFDLDAEQTVRTRHHLLDLATAENCRVVHYHIGGIGRVVRRGLAYAWEPEPASAALPAIVKGGAL